MAKLSAFRTDSKAKEEGEWVSPGPEYDDLQIKTKGFTNTYNDARAARMRFAATPFGGDLTRVPSAKANEITADLMIKHLLLDVRNLDDVNGQPVSFERFKEMIKDPDYDDLFIAAIKAAAIAGRQHTAEVEDDKKNSPKPSS